jgi:hypothetical protein
MEEAYGRANEVAAAAGKSRGHFIVDIARFKALALTSPVLFGWNAVPELISVFCHFCQESAS